MAQCSVSLECRADLTFDITAHEPDAIELIRQHRMRLTPSCFAASDLPVEQQIYRVEKYLRKGFSLAPA